MKKLLFVINTMGRAGAETALVELLRRLDATGRYDISLFALIPYGEMFSSVPKGVHILNKHYSTRSVLSLSGRFAIARRMVGAFFYKLTGFRMLGYLWQNLRQQQKSGRVQPDKLLWRVISQGTPAQKESYDLAVAYLEGAATYYVADRVNAKRKAAFVHIDYKQAGYLPMMDKDCYDKIDRIFTVSREVGRQFLSVYPQYQDKVFLFRNLLGRELILEKSLLGQGFDDTYQGVRLVTVGRLHYQKAYDIAIEALSQLRKDGYDARWYILGEGPERAELEKKIDRLSLKDEFILLGARDNPYPFVRQADIYVHATRFEGKSIAIEEAQILGKVIVASDCTGNTEQIIPEVDGVLLTLTKENLVAALERVIDDPALQRRLVENVKKKNLDYPEDMENLLSLLSEGGQNA